MVDSGTFNRLSPSDQDEYQNLSSIFVKAVLASETGDGRRFAELYKIHRNGDLFFLSDTQKGMPFAGITSRSKTVIEALLTDAVQNYGR